MPATVLRDGPLMTIRINRGWNRFAHRLLERRLGGEWTDLGTYASSSQACAAMLERPVGPYDYLVLPYAIQKSPTVVAEPPLTTSTGKRRLGGQPTALRNSTSPSSHCYRQPKAYRGPPLKQPGP